MSIAAGETIALTGRNGAGKSTLTQRVLCVEDGRVEEKLRPAA